MGRDASKAPPGWLAFIRLETAETAWMRQQGIVALTYNTHVRFDEYRGYLGLWRSYIDYCQNNGLLRAVPSDRDNWWWRLYPRPEVDHRSFGQVCITSWATFQARILTDFPHRLTPDNAPWNPPFFRFGGAVPYPGVPRTDAFGDALPPRNQRGHSRTPIPTTLRALPWTPAMPATSSTSSSVAMTDPEEAASVFELNETTQVFAEATTQTPTRDSREASSSTSASSSSSGFSHPSRGYRHY